MSQAEEEVVRKKRFSPLVIGIIVACLILISGGGYIYYTKMHEAESAHKRDPGVLLKLGDPKDGLILNIGGVNSGRFLKVSIIIELKPNKNAVESKTVTPEEAKILDTVVHLLRSQRVEDFDPSKQLQLKELIKHEIGELIGEDRVYDVYITNFILQ